MSNAFSVLPITVVAAVAIFVIKEIIELARRISADRRKLRAVKLIIARQIELNSWSAKRIEGIFNTIGSASDEGFIEAEGVEPFKVDFSVVLDSRGRELFRASYADSGDLLSSMPIPIVHTETMERLLLEAAILSEDFFENLKAGYEQALELKHVRDGIKMYVNCDEPDVDKSLLPGFTHYGEAVLRNWRKQAIGLYSMCTGKECIHERIR